MAIYIDDRWSGPHGIGRVGEEMQARLGLPPARLPLHPTHHLDFITSSIWMLMHPKDGLVSPGYTAPVFGLDRYAFVVHDLNHLDLPQDSSFLKRLYYKLVIRRACRRAAVVMTGSQFGAERISDFAGIPISRVKIVSNGVSEVFTNDVTAHPDYQNYYLVVGNRRPHKNEVRVVEAFAQLADTAPVHGGIWSSTTALR